MFGIKFNILLYDLTSTYFESDPPFPEGDKREFGYSRDKRSDCVQVVIALIVTPEGFPLAYEVLPGNTNDKTTLHDFLMKIEEMYGKAERIWIMDRGIPTEETLTLMRESDPRVFYLVGKPRSVLEKFEAIQMVDVHFPATDGRELIFPRYTQPEKDQMMLLTQLQLKLPPQSPPRITSKGAMLTS